MNKFTSKIISGCIDFTPITVIENCILKKDIKNIIDQILYYKNVTSKKHLQEENNFNADSNPRCYRIKWLATSINAPAQTDGDEGTDPSNVLDVETKNFLKNVLYDAVQIYLDKLPDRLRLTEKIIQLEKVQRIEARKMDIVSWFNINEKYSANQIHVHKGSFLNGVLYFRGENTGALRFYPTNYFHSHPNWFYNGCPHFYPKDGSIILFPAFLAHDVQTNFADIQRINAAFNVFSF